MDVKVLNSGSAMSVLALITPLSQCDLLGSFESITH